MSTVPEAIAARALGLHVRALALVTNAAARDGDAALSHDEVLAVARSRLPLMGELIALCLETA
jgi:purine nucleoside phosphorylase